MRFLDMEEPAHHATLSPRRLLDAMSGNIVGAKGERVCVARSAAVEPSIRIRPTPRLQRSADSWRHRSAVPSFGSGSAPRLSLDTRPSGSSRR